MPKFYLLKLKSKDKKDKQDDAKLSSPKSEKPALSKTNLPKLQNKDFEIIGYSKDKEDVVTLTVPKTDDTMLDYFRTYALRGVFKSGNVGYFDAVVNLTTLQVRLKYAINLVRKWQFDLRRSGEKAINDKIQHLLDNGKLAHAINTDIQLLPSYIPAKYPLLDVLCQELAVCDKIAKQLKDMKTTDGLKFKYQDYRF